MRVFVLAAVVLLGIVCAVSGGEASIVSFQDTMKKEVFQVSIQRVASEVGLLKGEIRVNGKPIGLTSESDKDKIPAGKYKGVLRYFSKRKHAQGPFGTMGDNGDFLLEVANVKQPDGKERTNILFHGGTKVEHTKGCILLGPVVKDIASGAKSVPDDTPLRRLRLEFYGSDTPSSTPDVDIEIEIADPDK